MRQRQKSGTPPKAATPPSHAVPSGGGSSGSGSGGKRGSGVANPASAMAGGITWGPWALAIDLVVLVALAAAARLWGLATPNSVVFDEYHFGKFINW